ncbi:L-aspartate oxidase [candidate division WOR-3 bacterium]|nr:L-aspartate oxidase [candidate division WOR-3 bacterium]
MAVHECDFLVVGSGIAGLWFAYRAAALGSVLVITKKQDTESNTNYAQGGIAAAVAEDDSAEIHGRDTLATGQGLAGPEIVELVTEAGPALVRELAGLGVGFVTYTDAQGRSQFDLGREGGHHRRRILHARDATGFEIERGLLSAVRCRPSVRFSEDHFCLDLALDEAGRCAGASVLNVHSGAVETVRARLVLLATGGIGQAYRHTTNPLIATGDGIAMGFRAGCRVANMEFIQFHPTALYGSNASGQGFLISEAVRGEGALLRTKDGRAFMEDYHPDGSLAPRDAVARAVDAEMKKRREEFVLLDATMLSPDTVRNRFPRIAETCLRFGIDMTRQPIPVVPAAHYVCGGLAVNSWAETSIGGLYAAGECACTGLHGANRLASNSLLEALVFADRAARRVRDTELPASGRPVSLPDSRPAGRHEQAAGEVRAALQKVMWDKAAIVRSDRGLAAAEDELAALAREAAAFESVPSEPCREAMNLLAVSRLVVASARRRSESRGLHYNIDHPATDEKFAADTVVTRAGLGW